MTIFPFFKYTCGFFLKYVYLLTNYEKSMKNVATGFPQKNCKFEGALLKSADPL